MHSEGLDNAVDKRLNLNTENPDLQDWKSMLSLKSEATKEVKIAILGK